MRHRTVCFRSSPQYLPDTVLPVPFPRSLTTTPFERSSTGRFEACSCKPTSGGRPPSLVQHHELALVFVTHCHFFACRPVGRETPNPVSHNVVTGPLFA